MHEIMVTGPTEHQHVLGRKHGMGVTEGTRGGSESDLVAFQLSAAPTDPTVCITGGDGGTSRPADPFAFRFGDRSRPSR